MLNIDLTAFLTQNTAFYAGFIVGLFLGAYLAYLFFKASFRHSKANNKELLNIISQKDKIIEQKDKENERQADIFAKMLVEKGFTLS